MKKLLLCLLICAGLGWSQGIPSVSPGIVEVTVDKAIETTKVLPPVTLSVNSGGHYAYTTMIPFDLVQFISITPEAGFIPPNWHQVFNVTLNVTNMNLGTHYIPIAFRGIPEGTSGIAYSVSVQIKVNVINSLNPNGDPNESDRMIPHIAMGGNWQTIVRVYNPGDTLIRQYVQLFDNDGKPMTMKVNGSNFKEFPLEISPKTTKDLYFAESGSLKTGTAVFKMTSGSIPGMVVIYQQKNPTRETAVEVKSGSDAVALKMNNHGRKSTGLVIGNFGKDTQDVAVDVYDLRGVQTQTKFLSVKPMGSVVMSTDVDLALNEMEGMIVIRGQGKWLSVYAIQFDLDAETFSTEPGVF